MSVDTQIALPDDDTDVKDVKGLMSRLEAIYVAAEKDAERRDALIARAVALLVNVQSQELKGVAKKVDLDTVEFFETPKMGSTGHGYRPGINYTRNRVFLHLILAEQLGCGARVAFTRYVYGGGSRRQPFVILAGTQRDRNLVILTAAGLGDVMDRTLRTMTFPEGTPPKAQSSARQQFGYKWAAQLGQQIATSLVEAKLDEGVATRVADADSLADTHLQSRVGQGAVEWKFAPVKVKA